MFGKHSPSSQSIFEQNPIICFFLRVFQACHKEQYFALLYFYKIQFNLKEVIRRLSKNNKNMMKGIEY